MVRAGLHVLNGERVEAKSWQSKGKSQGMSVMTLSDLFSLIHTMGTVHGHPSQLTGELPAQLHVSEVF